MPIPYPKNEAGRLSALHRFEILDTAPEAALDQIVQHAAKILNVPMAAISLVDKDRQWFKSTVGLDIQGSSRDDAFCAHST